MRKFLILLSGVLKYPDWLLLGVCEGDMVLAESDMNTGLSSPWAWGTDSVDGLCFIMNGGFLPLRNLYK